MNSTLRRIRKKAALGIFIGGIIATGLWGWYDKVHTLVLLEAVRLIERWIRTGRRLSTRTLNPYS
jgi:hypothetical protein